MYSELALEHLSAVQPLAVGAGLDLPWLLPSLALGLAGKSAAGKRAARAACALLAAGVGAAKFIDVVAALPGLNLRQVRWTLGTTPR